MRGQILFGLFLLTVFTAWAENEGGKAAEYLTKFGYLSLSRSGNHDSKTAIKRFQNFFHLKETGQLDEATKAEMSKPRCGLPDVQITGDRVRRYKTGSKWGKTTLTYRFANHGEDLGQSDVKSTIAKAFGIWSSVTPLQFRETSGRADFNIEFRRRSHGDNSPFDGPGRVLAHAYFPSNGRIHFDEDENWSVNGRRGIDLLWVSVHEIGHAIGLHHSNVRGTIMWPSYSGFNANLRLHSDDIRGIQSLYGGNGSGGGGTGGGGTGGGGSCVDKDRRCYRWGRYCSNNAYVKNNCKKMCRLC